MLRGRPPVETLLFSVALAVGLSPELLPAILSVNLARGAQMMARHGVLVRRLNAIENLGSMDVLCTDKTGTLTEGVVRLEGAYDADGAAVAGGARARRAATPRSRPGSPIRSTTRFSRRAQPGSSRACEKLAEIPFDFVRKRVSVVVATRRRRAGSSPRARSISVLDVCTAPARTARRSTTGRRAALERRYERLEPRGHPRARGRDARPLAGAAAYGRDDERDLAFAGFLTFLDRPKEGVARGDRRPRARSASSVKLITGDSRLVAQHVATLVGLRADRVLDRPRARRAARRGAVARGRATRTSSSRSIPNQKERIILALKKMGHVVGFLGDGVNDAPAMHAADTSLSVEQAVDVAREAADFVLLERDLDVIRARHRGRPARRSPTR